MKARLGWGWMASSVADTVSMTMTAWRRFAAIAMLAVGMMLALGTSPSMAELLGLKQDRVEQMVTHLHEAMKSVNQYLSVA